MRCHLAFAPVGRPAHRIDHVVVMHSEREIGVIALQVSCSGFEAPSPEAARVVATQLRTLRAPDDDPVPAARAALDSLGEEAAGWLARTRISPEGITVDALGGIEVQRMVGPGEQSPRTRADRARVPGHPQILSRGLGAGYGNTALEPAARWSGAPPHRLVILAYEPAIALDAEDVATADFGSRDPAMTLAHIAERRGAKGGFVIALTVLTQAEPHRA
jgi:hypothetical protein